MTGHKFLCLGSARRGFYLIGLLMALVIIAILISTGPFGRQQGATVSNAQYNIDKGKDAQCVTNRHTAKTYLAQYMIYNFDNPDINAIRQKIGHFRCPSGGAWMVDPHDANHYIYCTKHDPPPAQMLLDGNLMTIWEETPAADQGTAAPDPGTMPRTQGVPELPAIPNLGR